ncbi:hypothetical protein THASP1DRAFT_15932, partial [Thamnocephalis sphaerospora]
MDSTNDSNTLEQPSPAAGIPNFYACYLLRSAKNPAKDLTYIGTTPNPIRRLRQHNGELKQGARKTTHQRPWEFVALVHGFTSSLAALQFEWAWQYPYRSRQLEAIRAEDRALAKKQKHKAPRPISRFIADARSQRVSVKLGALAAMLSAQAWSRWPLKIWV